MAKKYRNALPQKPWAFLAYIAGDNNLTDAGLEDITEMCAVGASTNLHAAVQIDTQGAFDGVIRYEISEPDATGEAHRIVIERLPELDSGNPKALRDSLKWAFTRYPAKKRVVVIWNHGAGFRTRLLRRPPRRDIAYDDYGTSLDMNEIDGVFRDVGIDARNRISILGFDACLMNMVEIVHHLRHRAQYVVGSEQTEPGNGWPYDRVLSILNRSKSTSAAAKAIVDAYIRYYKDAGEQNVTQSAVDTDATNSVMDALSRLGNALAALLPGVLAGLRLIRTRVQSYEYADYVDLGHLCTLIRRQIKSGAAKNAAAAVATRLKAAVVAKRSYGAGVANSSGLSVWFPADAQLYLNFRAKYVALDFHANYPGWVDFLDRYHGA